MVLGGWGWCSLRFRRERPPQSAGVGLLLTASPGGGPDGSPVNVSRCPTEAEKCEEQGLRDDLKGSGWFMHARERRMN